MARCTAPSRGHRSAAAAANCPACGGRYSRYGSGGYSLYSGYVPNSQGTDSGLGGTEISSLFGRFGTRINSDPDILVLGGMGLGSTSTVLATFNAVQKA